MATKTTTRKPRATTKASTTKPRAATKAAERPPCLCSCGGFPAGAKSKYLPGHDARHFAALKRAERDAAAKERAA